MKSWIHIIPGTSFLCMFSTAPFPFRVTVRTSSTSWNRSIKTSNCFMNSVATKYSILRSAIYDSPVAFWRVIFVSEKYLEFRVSCIKSLLGMFNTKLVVSSLVNNGLRLSNYENFTSLSLNPWHPCKHTYNGRSWYKPTLYQSPRYRPYISANPPCDTSWVLVQSQVMPSVILEAGKLSVGEHLIPAESMAIRRRRFTFFIVEWVDFYVGLLK